MKGLRVQSLRRTAQLRELGDLGVIASHAAAMLGMQAGEVTRLTRIAGFSMPRKVAGNSPLMRAIREGYAKGLSPIEISELTGSPLESVAVLASNMGLKFKGRIQPGWKVRGFRVPDHLLDEYKFLRKKGIPPKEAGRALGLVPA